MYTKKVIDSFRNPKNYGKLKNADGIGKVGNIICGDVMWIYIKVRKNKKEQEIIEDIRFETFGCTAAIATSSMITQLAKNKTFKEALKIRRKDVIDALDGLPQIKIHCSVLAADALAEAIYDYLSKQKRTIPKTLQEKHQKNEKENERLKEKFQPK